MITLIALAQVLAFLGLAFALYRALARPVATGVLGHHVACLIYMLTLAALPWCLLWVFVPVSNFIFNSFPSLWVAAWDVGLAILLMLAMWLCYALALVAALVACRRFLSASRRHRSSPTA